MYSPVVLSAGLRRSCVCWRMEQELMCFLSTDTVQINHTVSRNTKLLVATSLVHIRACVIQGRSFKMIRTEPP